jgi:glycosyltransferase involved in cell wall biosynthesis
MRIALKLLDILVFYILGPILGLIGLCYIYAGRLFRKKALKKENPVNRLTFCIMDLEKDKSDLDENMLLRGAISKQIGVFFDFESDEDSACEISDDITSYRFSVHKKAGIAGQGFRKTGALFNLVKNIFFLKGVARAARINCVESHEAVFLGFVGLVFSRMLGTPFVLHLNTSYEMKYRGTGHISVRSLRFRKIERWLEYMACRLADVIVADRPFYKNLPFFPKECAKKYVTTGIKVEKEHYKNLSARKNLKEILRLNCRDIILYSGRLHPVKYVRDLIETFKEIREENKNASLLIAGEGILENELKETAKKYGLGDNVLFLGPKTQEELANLYFTADVMVQPHGGQVLLEGALAGTPSVVYDFDWHGEFVEDGKTGFIVPFGDTDALAAKTLQLLSDKQLRDRMGALSRESALGRYSRENSIENEGAVYSKVLRIDN